MVDAQNYLNTNYPNPAKNSVATIIDSSTAASKLVGELVIEDYPNLTEIKLNKNELTKLVIRNCPKVKKISAGENKKTLKLLKFDELNPSGINSLEKLLCPENEELETLSLKNCDNLNEFVIRNCKKLKKINGFERTIPTIDVVGVPEIRHIFQEKLSGYQEAKRVVKEVLGINPNEKLPDSVKTGGKLDGTKLRAQIENEIVNAKVSQLSQLQTEKEQAEKERDEAKNALTNLLTEIVNGAGLGLTGTDITKDKIIEKIKEIKQQVVQAVNGFLGEINNLGLGLTGTDITKEKVLEKIRDLIKKPTCTHTDYDAIKAERDRLKTENEKQENQQVITKEVLVQNAEKSFSGWGIADSNYKEQFTGASANEVEKIRNELIDKRFSELGKEKKTALVLNITLSVLTIGSLLVLGWLLMREASSKEEPEQGKKDVK